MAFLNTLGVESDGRNRAVSLISGQPSDRYLAGNNLLNREFPALRNAISEPSREIQSNNQKRGRVVVGAGKTWAKDWEHTASTRNKEDLPAFCRPIMVTSISVALQGKKSGISRALIFGDGPGRRRIGSPESPHQNPALKRPTYQNILKSQS